MKSMALVLLLPVVGLAGCGTLTAPPGARMASPQAVAAPQLGMVSQVDQGRMELIDREARKRGVQVVWINPPRRNVSAPVAGS